MGVVLYLIKYFSFVFKCLNVTTCSETDLTHMLGLQCSLRSHYKCPTAEHL